MWRVSPGRSRRTPPVGFILPCQPVLVPKPPAGLGWLHEVKHDGYRIIARKDGDRVTLWSRYGTNFTDRLPKIAEAVGSLAAENALIREGWWQGGPNLESSMPSSTAAPYASRPIAPQERPGYARAVSAGQVPPRDSPPRSNGTERAFASVTASLSI